ncbi:MAG: biopolymer transporter ExbD [Alphaproteobacteria bacterium]|nr:biopolymer transporter ExbD [Alphaproteobacteria bacterium]MCB9672797.1 biopolymer transporter ExbD [Alphaproteobacteria bacterium]
MAKKKTVRRGGGNEELNITSMMDMMTIILVFLLKSYSAEDISVQGNDDLVLPVSTSLKPPKLAVNVIVSRAQVLVDGEPVLSLVEEADPTTGQPVIKVPEAAKRGAKIIELYDKLVAKAEQAKRLGERAGNDQFDFKGQVLLQCDKRLPFAVIREVMYTAGQAQFGEFRFVVIKGSG